MDPTGPVDALPPDSDERTYAVADPGQGAARHPTSTPTAAEGEVLPGGPEHWLVWT